MYGQTALNKPPLIPAGRINLQYDFLKILRPACPQIYLVVKPFPDNTLRILVLKLFDIFACPSWCYS